MKENAITIVDQPLTYIKPPQIVYLQLLESIILSNGSEGVALPDNVHHSDKASIPQEDT